MKKLYLYVGTVILLWLLGMGAYVGALRLIRAPQITIHPAPQITILGSRMGQTTLAGQRFAHELL